MTVRRWYDVIATVIGCEDRKRILLSDRARRTDVLRLSREVACFVQLCNAPIFLMELHSVDRTSDLVASNRSQTRSTPRSTSEAGNHQHAQVRSVKETRRCRVRLRFCSIGARVFPHWSRATYSESITQVERNETAFAEDVSRIQSKVLTDIVGRAQNFSYVRPVTDVPRYAEVA